mmetsp:Transcript_15965/g.20265  ORF Transcript_15965/g.20265 Transcript_15965/m.20265 type:complete len:87 (-) Transcript_15965:372-632(-)
MDANAWNSLGAEQKQAAMINVQNQANQQIMQNMQITMLTECFKKCVGTSGDKLDSKEQSCLAMCQDRYFDIREQVQAALKKRQGNL